MNCSQTVSFLQRDLQLHETGTEKVYSHPGVQANIRCRILLFSYISCNNLPPPHSCLTSNLSVLKQRETNMTSNLSPSRKHIESRGVLKERERLT